MSQTVQAPLAFLGIGDGWKRRGERDQRVLELAKIVAVIQKIRDLLCRQAADVEGRGHDDFGQIFDRSVGCGRAAFVFPLNRASNTSLSDSAATVS